MKNGEKQIDVTQEVWIAIDEADEAALKELVGRFGAMLGQESMYLEKTGGTVDFVLPLALGE